MSKRRNQTSSVGSPTPGNISDSFSSKEQEQFLPIANISRIMKRALPTNAKISKEAKEKVQECVSEFISFITGEASDKCQREKRKTINGDDLLWAMTTLGFENYVGPLKVYLNNFIENEAEKSTNSNQSPTEEDDFDGVAEINNLANSVSTKAGTSFNGGFYSVESQVMSPSFTRVTGYTEISMNRAISQNVVIGDAYANGNMW